MIYRGDHPSMSYDEQVMQNNCYLHSSWVISSHSSYAPITKQFHHPIPVPVEDHGVPVPPDRGCGVAVDDAGYDGLLAQPSMNNNLVHRDLRLVWSEVKQWEEELCSLLARVGRERLRLAWQLFLKQTTANFRVEYFLMKYPTRY